MTQDTLLGTDVLRLVQPPSQFMFLCIVKSLFFFLKLQRQGEADRERTLWGTPQISTLSQAGLS